MSKEIVLVTAQPLAPAQDAHLPPDIVVDAGGGARYAWDEFFSGIESPNTLRAYRKAVTRLLLWCEDQGLELKTILPGHVSAYMKQIRKENGKPLSKASRKLHLSAIRNFFDACVTRHAVLINPALSVKGPRLKIREGKTPPLLPKQARKLVKALDISTVVGLRDRAAIGILIYTCARVGGTQRRVSRSSVDGSTARTRTEEAPSDLAGFMNLAIP